MQIILLEKIANVGNLGDVVKVKNGYARNFLIPQGKAKRATPENLKAIEAKRAAYVDGELTIGHRLRQPGAVERRFGVIHAVPAGELGEQFGLSFFFCRRWVGRSGCQR